MRLELEMRVFKLAWESKRQTAYARVREEWSLSQLSQKKVDATRNSPGAKAQASAGTPFLLGLAEVLRRSSFVRQISSKRRRSACKWSSIMYSENLCGVGDLT